MTYPAISDKSSIRLNHGGCLDYVKKIDIDLGKIMTVTGFSFQSNIKIKWITVRFSIDRDIDEYEKRYTGIRRNVMNAGLYFRVKLYFNFLALFTST